MGKGRWDAMGRGSLGRGRVGCPTLPTPTTTHARDHLHSTTLTTLPILYPAQSRVEGGDNHLHVPSDRDGEY